MRSEILLAAVAGVTAGVTACWMFSLFPHRSKSLSSSSHSSSSSNSSKKIFTKQKSNTSPTPATPATPLAATKARPVNLNYVSVGLIHSCFPTCRGTPRQGFLMPTSKVIKKKKKIFYIYIYNIYSRFYTHCFFLFCFFKISFTTLKGITSFT